MTAPDNQDPWGSLADSLGLPARSDAEKSGEAAASTPPAAAPVTPPPAPKPAKPEPVRRDPKPAAPADWGALASDFGLEPEPEPTTPVTPQPARPAATTAPEPRVEARTSGDSGASRDQSEQRRERPTAPARPPKRAEHDDIAQKLATGSRLWDDEPAAAPAKPAPTRTARPEPEPAPEPDEPAPSFAGPDFMEREVRKAREPLAADDGDEAQADRPAADADADADEDRPRRRRRGRRGGRGRSRARRDEESRDRDDADASVRDEFEAGDEELADRLSEDREAAAADRSEEGEPADAEARDEPRRGRSRRGRGRRSRRGSESEGSRRPARDEEGDDRLDDREPRGEDDDELTDAVNGEALETSEEAVGEDGEPRKKRRRRGRRGGRRRSKTREGEAASDEADDDSGDDSTPTGYVGAAKPAKAEGGRRKEPEGEKSGDERRRRRRRGRGSSDEKSGSRGRGRPAFRPVSSSFSQDDEGLEYLGLDDAGDGDAPLPARRSDADTDEAVAESGLDAVREVPSWVEAIGIVIAGNLDARAKSPRQDNGRSSRGRSGR